MLRPGELGLWVAVMAAGSCYAAPPDAGGESGYAALPDREMLEFLAEFDAMDDEEFELLVAYAKKDSEDETSDPLAREDESEEVNGHD